MGKFKHKYIFYFFPKFDSLSLKQMPGTFLFYGRSKDGKAVAKELEREFDYKKLY